MYNFIVFLLVWIVSFSFFTLEEETLIIFASVLWLDAAGSLIKQVLWSEVESRGDVIKSKFVWYLSAKKSLLELLITKQQERKNIISELFEVHLLYLNVLLNHVLYSFYVDSFLLKKYEIKNDVVITGVSVINDILCTELLEVLEYVNSEDIGSKDWYSNDTKF